jgi:hypothetical protein
MYRYLVQLIHFLLPRGRAIEGYNLFDVAIPFGYPLPSRQQSHAPKPNGRKLFDLEISLFFFCQEHPSCHLVAQFVGKCILRERLIGEPFQ